MTPARANLPLLPNELPLETLAKILMRTVPVTTEWMLLMRRIRRSVKFAKDKKFIAVSVDLADIEQLLASVDPDGKDS